MNKPKILVVDDEPSNLELIEGILSKDYEVIKAYNGLEALIKVKETVPDLILLDIMMPNTNGYAVCRELKTNNETMRIPVIMITALDKDKDKMNAIESNADDFMKKPIDINELRAKIKSWLNIKKQGDFSSDTSSNIHIYKVF